MADMERAGKDSGFVYITTIVYFALTLFNILHHEMWRDELHAWMIAVYSNSVTELFQVIRYEGHPSLWFIILYIVKHLTTTPVAMQIVHLLIATFSAFIFLRFAPFKNLLKALFIFGYFPFFEYANISRNYSIGILLLFIFCVFFRKDLKNRNYITLAVILFLMCQCNVFSTILAISLGITIFFEPLLFRDFSVYKSGRFFTAIFIFMAGLVLSVIIMVPPADSFSHPSANFTDNIAQRVSDQISQVWNVFLPIPRIQKAFWQTNFLSYLPLQREVRYALRLVVSLGLLLFPLCIILRKKTPAFYYIISIVGITAFGYLLHGGSLRHKGHFYFVFVSALWISDYYRTNEFIKPSLNSFFNFFERNRNYFITAIFSFGLIGALIANTLDYLYPFSASKETANYIKQHSLQNMPIASLWAFPSSGVSAYLDRAFYNAEHDRMQTFTLLKPTTKRKEDVHSSEFDSVGSPVWFSGITNVVTYRNNAKADVLLIVNNIRVPDELIKHYGLIALKEFTNSIVKEERYFLYIMPYAGTSP
ncbi:MAG: hypothetical protein H7844_14620 [Nitrospirae bacterium YQR-1]